MKYTASLLTLVFAVPAPATPEGPAWTQDWLGHPILPEVFQGSDPPPAPPAAAFRPSRSVPESPAEPSWGRGLSAQDLETWRREDELREVREWAGDALFGVPLLIPQMALEALIPRGLKVGPTTFLYRTSPASSSLVLVVFDQLLFHEAEFLARAQEMSETGSDAEILSRGQRRLLRQSFASGLRATYAVPGLTMDLALQAAAEQGALGYLLAPGIAGAVLYFKGIDQRIQIADEVRARVKLASGRDWVRGAGSASGEPTLSIDVRFCEFPVGLMASFDLSERGLTPAFVGIGTSLDAVEELLGREQSRTVPVDR